MTSTFTISCPHGIVMAADSRITLQGVTQDGITKIYAMTAKPIGISYWGFVGFNDMTVLEHLLNFETSHVIGADTVDEIAEKLKAYLENINPPISESGGFHLAECIQNQSYRLRHVFHEAWHSVGEFTNENCHTEYHDQFGNKILFRHTKPYPVLFNGDNFVANALFNYAPMVDKRFSIRPDRLSIEEAIDLSKLILNWAIGRLTFYFGPNQRRALRTTGGKPLIAKITCQSGFEWIQPRQEEGKGVWAPKEPTGIEKDLIETVPHPQEETTHPPHLIPSSNVYYGSVDIFPFYAPDKRETEVVGLTCYLPSAKKLMF